MDYRFEDGTEQFERTDEGVATGSIVSTERLEVALPA